MGCRELLSIGFSKLNSDSAGVKESAFLEQIRSKQRDELQKFSDWKMSA